MADVSPIDTTLGFLQWGIELVMRGFGWGGKWPENKEKLNGLTLPIAKASTLVTGLVQLCGMPNFVSRELPDVRLNDVVRQACQQGPLVEKLADQPEVAEGIGDRALEHP
jgi:hypothetical protein